MLVDGAELRTGRCDWPAYCGEEVDDRMRGEKSSDCV